jgi:hypothetical protein
LAAKTKLDKGRISLQASMIKLLGGEQANVWIFVVDPGHLRVFSHQRAKSLMDLDAYKSGNAVALETREKRERIGGMRLRLISSEMDKRRLKIPEETFDICEENLDRTYVWLEESTTHLDLYTATYMQRALAIPPGRFMPESAQEGE